MKNQVLNTQSIVFLCVIVLLTCCISSISSAQSCQVGDVLSPGESCIVPGTGATFSVLRSGSGRYMLGRTTLTYNNSIRADGFAATRQAGRDTWLIEQVPTSLQPIVSIPPPLPIYWSDYGTDKIQQVNTGSSTVEDLVTSLPSPAALALDIAGGKMYWTNFRPDKIQRANLDGSNVEDLVTGLGSSWGIALDIAGGKMYWTNYNADKIQRANLDGSNVEDLVTGLESPRGIALDITDGKMYWTELDGVFRSKIQRATLDGSNVQDLITSNILSTTYVSSIALDVTGNKMYWIIAPNSFNRLIVPNEHKIQRATLDGSNVEDLVAGFIYPSSIALGIPPSSGTIAESADVNNDGVVNIQDLVLVASSFGRTGQSRADVNGDGIVNIQDLVLVAGAFGEDAAAAPALHPSDLEGLTAANVQQMLTQARQMALTDPAYLRGILVLEQLLARLLPKKTALSSNYPNPFNPETWLPYHLAKAADVTVTIYDTRGVVVRELMLGHQAAGVYESRGRAAYWDGRNHLGEPVASGVYFYTLTAGDFTATRKMLIQK